MAIWNEADHPRDEEGKFTWKNGGEESYEAKMQRRADILYPTMNTNKTKHDTLPTNTMYHSGIKYSSKQSVRNLLGGIMGNEAAENLGMSKSDVYMNTKYAKRNCIIEDYSKTSPIFSKYLKEKICRQLELNNLSDNEKEEKLKNIKGIYIHVDSPSSIKLSDTLCQNASFMGLLKSNFFEMQLGKVVSGSVQFTDKNFHNALGKADIREMRYLGNGDIDLFVTDIYDFNKNETNPKVRAGRDFQEAGYIKPYFIIYHVIITKEQQKRLSR